MFCFEAFVAVCDSLHATRLLCGFSFASQCVCLQPSYQPPRTVRYTSISNLFLCSATKALGETCNCINACRDRNIHGHKAVAPHPTCHHVAKGYDHTLDQPLACLAKRLHFAPITGCAFPCTVTGLDLGLAAINPARIALPKHDKAPYGRVPALDTCLRLAALTPARLARALGLRAPDKPPGGCGNLMELHMVHSRQAWASAVTRQL